MKDDATKRVWAEILQRFAGLSGAVKPPIYIELELCGTKFSKETVTNIFFSVRKNPQA